MLNFGLRRYQCGNCSNWIRMKPIAYLKWSALPFAALLLSVLTIRWGLLWAFVGLAIGIRIGWAFVAPHIVPLERFN